jgi:hypothetical protein
MEEMMSRIPRFMRWTAVAVFALAGPALAQEQKPPMFETKRIEGTDNVYAFRYQNSQAMFVVTPEGVIATDPIGLARPQAVTTYIDEIRKVTQAPIRSSRAANRSRTQARPWLRMSARKTGSSS